MSKALKPINMADKAQATRGLAERIMGIMKSHIGRENSITQDELFQQLFHQKMDLEHRFDHWGWWEFTKKAMHYCRANTKCFIVINKDGHRGFKYCVVKNENDLNDYADYLMDNIKRMKKMIEKGQTAIEEKWYNEQWALPERKTKVKEVEQHKESFSERLLGLVKAD